MDKKTFIQFLVVSALMLALWYGAVAMFGIGKRPPVQPQPVRQQPDQDRPPAMVAHPDEPVRTDTEMAAVETRIVLRNDLVEMSWTNRGAALRQVQLLSYRAPYTELVGGKPVRPVLTLVREFQDGYLSDVVNRVTLYGSDGLATGDTQTDRVMYAVKSQSPDSIVFEGDLVPGRLRVRKTISLPPGVYHCNVVLEFINLTDGQLRYSYQLRGAAGVEQETQYRPSVGTAVGCGSESDFDVEELLATRIAKKGPVSNEATDILWAGAANRYFIVATQPEKADWVKKVISLVVEDSDMRFARGRWGKGALTASQERKRLALARSKATVLLCTVEHVLGARGGDAGSLAYKYRLICAPKSDAILKPYGQGMPDMLRSGVLGGLKRIVTALLRFFYRLIPNYGVAILLLTILVRLALHPLTRAAQIGMHKSSLLQPKMAELKRKYGDDRERLTKETWALQRRYGVNPMKGCLPMFFQLPVFIALFRTLGTALELRQAAFIPGWINDLSQPDRTFLLPSHLPVIGNEINLLPLIMVGVSVLSQRMMPKPADPQAQQQQKIFRWMPVFFGFILYHMASGLLLYWTASTSIGILESWLVRRKMRGVVLKPKEEQAKPTKPTKGRQQARAPEKKGLFGMMLEKLAEQQKKSEKLAARKNRRRKN